MAALGRLIGALVCLAIAHGSHFRGGFVSWRPADPYASDYPKVIKVTYRVGWRSSAGYHYRCQQSHIDSRAEVLGSGSLSCRGASSHIASKRLSFVCTDFSTTENWSVGQQTKDVVITAPPSNGMFTVGYSSCCWIRLQGGGGGWSVYASVNLTKRSDTGMINSSPQPSTAPIFRIQQGCTQQLKIGAFDPDGDQIRCRFASGYSECGGMCNSIRQYATLDEVTCTLTFNATIAPLRWYGVAIMLEDFASPADTTPLSSVPLQFLIRVFYSGPDCLPPPSLVEPTFKDGACKGVGIDTMYTFMMMTKSGGDSDPVSDMVTSSPVGLTKKSLPGNIFQFSWRPSADQAGQNLFCGSPLSSNGIAGDQRCMTMLAGVLPPRCQVDALKPAKGEQPVGQLKEIVLPFDKTIARPDDPKYVNIYSSNNDSHPVHSIDVLSSGLVTFTDSAIRIDTSGLVFVHGMQYYIGVDDGVAKGVEFCGADADVSDIGKAWTFANLNCYGRQEGDKFADPGTCKKYYKCVHGSPMSMPCAPKTWFDERLSVCIHERGAGCPDDMKSDPCASQSTGKLLADPTDCHKYIMCVNKMGMSMPCPGGTRFSGGACVRETSSDCNAV